MIHLIFRIINRLSVHSFSVNANDNDDFPEKNSFDKYYITLVEIKDVNVLINNKPFFELPIQANKNRIKRLLKYQETMTIQQGTYWIT